MDRELRETFRESVILGVGKLLRLGMLHFVEPEVCRVSVWRGPLGTWYRMITKQNRVRDVIANQDGIWYQGELDFGWLTPPDWTQVNFIQDAVERLKRIYTHRKLFCLLCDRFELYDEEIPDESVGLFTYWLPRGWQWANQDQQLAYCPTCVAEWKE